MFRKFFGEPLNSEGARMEGGRGVKEKKRIFVQYTFYKDSQP